MLRNLKPIFVRSVFKIRALNFVPRSLNTMTSSNKFELSKKYHGLERNVWVEFIQLALEHKPLNLGQGLPDDLVPHHVLASLEQISGVDGPLHQYTRGFGHPRLVNVIAKTYSKLLFRPIEDSLHQILVTVGAYEALFTAIMSHIDPGDEVIIIEPYFDCYEPMVRLAGGTPRFIALKPRGETNSASDWKLDYEELAKTFNSKTKALIFNNPNNPLGKVYTLKEMEIIAELCIDKNVMCIADEVYEHMVFDSKDTKMIRMATIDNMWSRTITIGSAGKTFSVTGWKLGWALGPINLIRNCQIAHQNCVYTMATPLQEAVAIALEYEMSRFDSPQCYFRSISNDLQRKRDYMVEMLTQVGFEPVIPQGGYFIIAKWSQLADKIDLTSENDEQRDYKFVKWLTKNVKLQGIPPSAFFCQEHKFIGEDYIRFCFIKKNETLVQAKEILSKWSSEL